MKQLLLVTAFLALCTESFSQEALKSTEEEYYDFLSLQGLVERPTLNYRTLSDSVWEQPDCDSSNINTTHPWQNNNLGKKYTLWTNETENENWFTQGLNRNGYLKLYGPEWFNSYNTSSPYGQNDGALWQGKGYNTSISAGARFEGMGFELTLKPQLSFSQNKSFDFMPGVYGSEYSYFWSGNIDLVQRYGDSSFWTYDWGDTEIRWNWHKFTIGFGYQNPWLGSAWLNPMLGSNNAASYPKIDIGLRKTSLKIPYLDWYMGDIEGRIWTGKLTESSYFDTDSSNDSRMLNAISLAYAPSFIPGLKIGVNRIFLTYWKKENIKYIKRLFTLEKSNALASSGNDEDQKVALNADWMFPQIGFEVYGELGIDDFTSQKISNPFHTAIYTVGVKQYIPLSFDKINPKFKTVKSELIFEWNNFEMSQDFQMQWKYMGYYAHGFVKQGYTQNGQILGAGSGYFGNSQYLAWKFFFNKGYFMPFLHRWCPDNNYIYSMTVGSADVYGSEKYSKYYGCYKTYRSIGASGALFVKSNLMLEGSLEGIFITHPDYLSTSADKFNCRGTFLLKVKL